MRIIITIIFSIMLAVASVGAFDCFDLIDYPLLAQLDDNQMNNEQREQIREEMHNKFEQLKLVKMLELLNLDENTEAQFISIYRQHSKSMKNLMNSRKGLIKELSQLIRAKSEDRKKYEEIFEKIDKVDIQHTELIHSYFDQLKSVLTNDQIGKLYIFHDRFGPELMGRIRNMRDQKLGGHGMKNR